MPKGGGLIKSAFLSTSFKNFIKHLGYILLFSYWFVEVFFYVSGILYRISPRIASILLFEPGNPGIQGRGASQHTKEEQVAINLT